MDFSTRHPDCRVSHVEVANKRATVAHGHLDDARDDLATTIHELSNVVRYAENNLRAVDETISELESDQSVVDVRLSYVDDTRGHFITSARMLTKRSYDVTTGVGGLMRACDVLTVIDRHMTVVMRVFPYKRNIT